MATLTLQDASAGLANVTFAAAAGGGDVCPAGVSNGGWQMPVVLLVKNTDAATKTVTVDGLAAVIVPATTGQAALPVLVGKGTDGTRSVTYSAVTGVTVAAVKLF